MVDLAFTADLLDARSKTQSDSGSQGFGSGTVTGAGQQGASTFSGESIGTGAAPGECTAHPAESSHELADLLFIEDLLDSHSKSRSGSADVLLSALAGS